MPTKTKSEYEVFGERVKYIEREFGDLKGKTVAFVRPLTKAECEQFAWDYDYDSDAMAIFFTDGTIIIPSQDPEGNGAGFLFKIGAEDK